MDIFYAIAGAFRRKRMEALPVNRSEGFYRDRRRSLATRGIPGRPRFRAASLKSETARVRSPSDLQAVRRQERRPRQGEGQLHRLDYATVDAIGSQTGCFNR